MPATSNHTKSRKRKELVSNRIWILFLGIVSFILIVLYLYGRIQINIDLREIDQMEQESAIIQQEIDDLRLQVNVLKRYDRIFLLAKKQGLMAVRRSNELPVDLSGLEEEGAQVRNDLKYAGFSTTSLK